MEIGPGAGVVAGSGSQGERWIVMWKLDEADQQPMPLLQEQLSKALSTSAAAVLNAAVCSEAEDGASGRFSASCVFQYSGVLDGFAASFNREQLVSFMQVRGGEPPGCHGRVVGG